MSLPVTLAEPTTDIRDWLRGAGLAVGARVFCDGFPKGVTLPAVGFSRIGGPLVDMVDQGLYGFEVRAPTMPAAKTAAYELAELLTNTVQLDLTDVRIAGASIAALNPITDPDDPSLYRMVLTAQITTITTS